MTDTATETAMLEAVRDTIRSSLSLADHECQIEYDDLAPAIVGDLYVVVLPGGLSDGPAHRGGHVIDEMMDVDVTVVKRATAKPRDMHREVYLRNLTSLNDWIQKIRDAIDFSYTVNDAANAIILRDAASSEGFVEPLKYAGMDRRPQLVRGEYFAATNEPAAGLKRTVFFRGARRLQSR